MNPIKERSEALKLADDYAGSCVLGGGIRYGKERAALEAELSRQQTEIHELRTALAALRSMPAEPVAWLVPEIMSFKGVKFTSCPKEAQDAIEGTVGWSPSMIGDMPPVTDKHGVTHHPKPLYATPHTAPLSDAEIERIVSEMMVNQDGYVRFSASLRDFARAIERAVLGRGGEK